MLGAGKKLDLTQSSLVPASAQGLWPHLTDIARWTRWLRSPDRRQGLEAVEALPHTPSIDPRQPELGRRFRFRFTNGFAGEFRVVYWVEPAQISLELVPDTRQAPRGVEGLIFDLDFFPQPDGSTKLWFGALVLLEKGFKPGLLARWPKREVQSWVEGFHARAVAEGPALTKGARTKKEVAAASGAAPRP